MPTGSKSGIDFLYLRSTLDTIFSAAKNLDDKRFSEFQRTLITTAFPQFNYDFCTTSTIVSDTNGLPIELSSVLLDLPDDAVENYLKYAEYDDLSPLVYQNPGRLLQYTHMYPSKKVPEHPIFIHHCAKYGIHKVSSIGFLHPGHKQTYVAFDYMGAANNEAWHKFDHTKLELASFPFALAWFERKKAIDELALTELFVAISGLSETQLTFVRKFVSSNEQTQIEQANSLGVSTGAYKNVLGKVRDILMEKLNDPRLGQSGIPLRYLDGHLSSLKLLGDPTAPIQGLNRVK